MTLVLTFLFLICAAVLFGLFFLIFKIIWLILKKKENFWPLVLSGVLTFLLMLLASIALYRVHKQFIKPLNPILVAANVRQEPVFGPRLYTDDKYPFALTLHDGLVLSDWFVFDPTLQVKIGIDLNPVYQNQTTDIQN